MNRLSKLLIGIMMIMLLVMIYQFNKNALLNDITDTQGSTIKVLEETNQQQAEQIETLKEHNSSYQFLIDDYKVIYDEVLSKYNALKEYYSIFDYSDRSELTLEMSTIEENLLTKSDMIALDEDSPWQMFFTDIRVLSNSLAIGYFEDGHSDGYGIYEFSVENNEITWKIIYERMNFQN